MCIHPLFDEFSFAEGKLMTPFGTIKVRWDKQEKFDIIYKLSVPNDTTAKIIAPCGYEIISPIIASGENKIVFKRKNII